MSLGVLLQTLCCVLKYIRCAGSIHVQELYLVLCMCLHATAVNNLTFGCMLLQM